MCNDCATCASGQVWTSGTCTPTTNGGCTACGVGKYASSTRQYTCTDCPSGQYQNVSQRTACVACQVCNPGYYQAAGCLATANRVCAGCLPGSFSAANNMPTCTGCGEGLFQTLALATRCENCQACPAGSSWGDSCIPTKNAVCAQCAAGTYNPSNATSLCLRCAPGSYQDVNGSTACKGCTACSAGRYLASGCNGVSDGVCATCTVCQQDTVRPCTKWTDAVCGNASLCLARPAPSVFAWIDEKERCQAGKYLLSYSPATLQKECRPCPLEWAGLNGVFCERCGPLEEPYYQDRSSCVCREPAVMNASGACVCPDGYGRVGSGCGPCGANNTYGTGGTCSACPAGSFSTDLGATACTRCEFGKYRLSGQAGACLSCPLTGWYAPDARSGACVRCNTSCAMDGWRWDSACPGDTTGLFSVCKECAGGLPGNASWGNQTECAYDCLPGFYRLQGGCGKCTARACQAGWRRAECSEWADSNCDTECVDASKPALHSRWTTGENCPWACDEGYELRVWDYVLFQLRECAAVG